MPQSKPSTHLSHRVCVGGVCEAWLKNTPQMNRQKKKILPCASHIPQLLCYSSSPGRAVGLQKYLKAKSLCLVTALSFDTACCGKSGLWLFRVQTLHEVRPQLDRAGEISLVDRPGWEVCWERAGCTSKSLHPQVADSFLGSCFLSDNNNKSNFRAFSSRLFLVL